MSKEKSSKQIRLCGAWWNDVPNDTGWNGDGEKGWLNSFFKNETLYLFLFPYLTPEPCRRPFLPACLPWGAEKRVWRIPFICGSNGTEENLSGISGAKQVIHQVIPRHIFFFFPLNFCLDGIFHSSTSVSSLIPRCAQGNRMIPRSCATVRNYAPRRKKEVG